MIYDKTTLYFPQGTSTWMPIICNYFNQFSDRFRIENNYIIWDNKVKFTFTDAFHPEVLLRCNDSQSTLYDLGGMGYWHRSGTQTWGIVTFILTDTLFYFTIVDTEYGTIYSDCSGEFVSVIDDNGNYFAGYAYENFSANAVSFYNVDDAVAAYQIGKMFNFATESQKILWSSICPISHSSGYFSNISTIMNCSNITQGIVITINGKNYYTVGTNILLPMDD